MLAGHTDNDRVDLVAGAPGCIVDCSTDRRCAGFDVDNNAFTYTVRRPLTKADNVDFAGAVLDFTDNGAYLSRTDI